MLFYRFSVLFLAIAITLLGSRTLPADAVINGTFDNNTSGWTGTYTVVNGPGGGFPTIDTGTYFFAGNNSFNEITQVYDLSVFELADLASGGLNYHMSGDLFGFGGGGDYSSFTAEFFSSSGGTGTSLDTVTLGGSNTIIWESTITAGEAPNFLESFGVVPTATQSIKFSLSSTLVSGASNDGYADNLTFNMSSVPEPTSFALLGLAGLGFLGLSRRRRSNV